MTETKQTNQRIRGSEILVAFPTKKMFKEYCKEQGIEMQTAANEILLYIVKNKIPLQALSDMMDKNITKEVKRYHNYMVGFLNEFEKKQLAVIKNQSRKPSDDLLDESGIIKVMVDAIFKDVEFLMEQNTDNEFTKGYLEQNKKNISKAFLEGNVWKKDGIMRVKLREILRDLSLLMRSTADYNRANEICEHNKKNIERAENDNEN